MAHSRNFDVFWQLPVNGDGRSADKATWSRGDYQGVPERAHAFARIGGQDERISYFDHLVQIARAAELAGFDGLFIPQTDEGEEPLVTAGALARDVKRIRLAPQLPAHFLSAVYTAKIATSFQRLTGGRLVLNLVTQDPAEHSWHGYTWSEDEQVARADEFLTVVKGVWNEGPYTFEGQYYEVKNGGFNGPLKGQPKPEVFLSGTSNAALALSAKHADVHILEASSPENVATQIAKLQALAQAQNRTLRFALSAVPTARHTEADARRDAEFARPSDAGDDALIGDFDQVAARLTQYLDAGISTLILKAHPHLEEAYRTAQHVLPRLPGWGQPAAAIAAE